MLFRSHDRRGVFELQFLSRHRNPVLPVLYGGELRILPWGNARGGSCLPPTLWTMTATIASGGWQHTDAEEAVIPATLGLDGGIWLPTGRGVHGLVVSDERGGKRVYVVVEPASRYYGVMCKSRWMPVVEARMEWHCGRVGS